MEILYKDLVPLLAVVCGSIVGVVAIVATHIRISQRDEMAATLKIEMIQRGMSADEIERILRTPLTTAVVSQNPATASAAHVVS